MALKSSWELALERTGGKSAGKLTTAQKEKLAELERVYKAKIAEVELDLTPKITTARAAGKVEEVPKLEENLRVGVARLRDKLEQEKEKIRNSS